MQGVWGSAVSLWVLCLVAGASCAVFYTQSSDNNYPRIGRRAFFTRGDKGSSYPRIGRSSPGPEAHAMNGDDVSFVFPTKRSGSRDGGQENQELKKALELLAPSAFADMVMSLEGQGVEGRSGEPSRLPLGLLFFHLDKNGDKVLTREELVRGMARVREVGVTCR